MNRIINDPDLVVEDALRGYLRAHPDLLATTGNPRVLRHPGAPRRGKVGVVTGGGSGHEPAFLGYIGPGMVDAVAVGEIFSSPTAKSFSDAFAAADGGRGVACLYGNVIVQAATSSVTSTTHGDLAGAVALERFALEHLDAVRGPVA